MLYAELCKKLGVSFFVKKFLKKSETATRGPVYKKTSSCVCREVLAPCQKARQALRREIYAISLLNRIYFNTRLIKEIEANNEG